MALLSCAHMFIITSSAGRGAQADSQIELVGMYLSDSPICESQEGDQDFSNALILSYKSRLNGEAMPQTGVIGTLGAAGVMPYGDAIMEEQAGDCGGPAASAGIIVPLIKAGTTACPQGIAGGHRN